jgi:23S rRNA pseudouridine2605 synthase
MNKPNRKFSPKQSGGERNERPRRPRSNEGTRAAGFSDKRYSPLLDPDDNKEWKQRDEAGRRYRPAQQDSPSGRPNRSGEGQGQSYGDRSNRRPGGYRSQEGDAKPRFRSQEGERPNFRKGGDDSAGRPTRRYSDNAGNNADFERRPRFTKGSDAGDGPSRPRRTGDFGDKPNFRPRSEGYGNRRDDDSRGGERSDFRRANNRGESRYEARPEGRRSDGPRTDAPRGNKFQGDSPRSGNRYGDENRSGDSRSTSPRSSRYGDNSRSDDSRGNSFRSEGPRGNTRRGGQEDERPARTPFKKKEMTERKASRPVASPPSYDFSKIRTKGPKVSHTEANIRLNKYIADSGICSRRDADELIASGQIKVNGEVITQMGYKVSRNDAVTYNGKKINPEKLVYVLLNKPKDFITTTDDPQERKTVMDLVDNAAEQRIYPVGRLDRNTTGLLLLTNDGDLAEKLSHPSHKVKKVYQVLLDKPLAEEDFDKIMAGVTLEDGPAPVDELGYVIPDKTVVGVEIHIGRNRIVRRIFESLGYDVLGLDRVIYAGLTKKDLPRGDWRYLSQKEVIRLKHFN